MTRQRPPELFAPERPVQSTLLQADTALAKSYARRRLATVTVLALIIGGTAYGLWGGSPRAPADIPTIQAESGYKQKPADPGGIDIPHQDVQVYDELENKSAAPQVEHLLSPPEAPPVMPHPAPASAPVAVASPPVPPSPMDTLLQTPPKTTVATTVSSAHISPVIPHASVPASPPASQNLTIEQVIKATQASAGQAAGQGTTPQDKAAASDAPLSVLPQEEAASVSPLVQSPPAATGVVAVQLASVTDSVKAQSMMADLQHKYAAQLGTAQLHIARADLGSRGIFYRIQSQGLSETAANQICSSLRQLRAGCILVKK